MAEPVCEATLGKVLEMSAGAEGLRFQRVPLLQLESWCGGQRCPRQGGRHQSQGGGAS